MSGKFTINDILEKMKLALEFVGETTVNRILKGEIISVTKQDGKTSDILDRNQLSKKLENY